MGWTATPDSAWITISTARGDENETLGISVDPTGLAPGVYTGNLTFASIPPSSSVPTHCAPRIGHNSGRAGGLAGQGAEQDHTSDGKKVTISRFNLFACSSRSPVRPAVVLRDLFISQLNYGMNREY